MEMRIATIKQDDGYKWVLKDTDGKRIATSPYVFETKLQAENDLLTVAKAMASTNESLTIKEFKIFNDAVSKLWWWQFTDGPLTYGYYRSSAFKTLSRAMTNMSEFICQCEIMLNLKEAENGEDR